MSTLLRNLAISACIAATATFGQSDWVVAKSGTHEILTRVAWSHGQLIALTGQDTILTSPDGVAWTKTWTNRSLSSVTWAEGKYFAVGSRQLDDIRYSTGVVFSSVDGRAWTVLDERPNQYSNYLNDIIWADTQFVAVGEPSIILTSPDGRNWVTRTRVPNIAGSYRSVEWTGRLFVVVGVDRGIGVDRSAVLTSPDGVEWKTISTGGKSELSEVVWTGTQLVAVGRKGLILTSPDGVAWTSRSSGTNRWLQSVAWTGRQLVAIGRADSGVVLSSPDGITWTDRTPAIFSCHSLVWTGQLLVAVGDFGGIQTSLEDPVSISPNVSLSRDFKLHLGLGEIRYTLPEFAQGRYATATIYSHSGKSIVSHGIFPGQESRVPVHPLAQGKYLFELQVDGKSFSRFFDISR